MSVVEQVRARFRSVDVRLLASLATIAILLATFVYLADEITETDTDSIDRTILLGLRTSDLSDPVGPAWLEYALINLSALGSGVVVAVLALAVAGFLLLDGRPRYALLVIVCVAGTWIAMDLLKGAFGRERPDVVPHLVEEHGLSFPSGHSMTAAAVYLTLAELLARTLDKRRLRIYTIAVAATIALLVGFTRVFMGVHYPSDVLAGWAIGVSWALLLGVVTRSERVRAAAPPGA
jgi:undecaprenyl-diphosphatase